ncbi:hypothetical protein [Streptomyces sp. NPDC057554]|uniref:hypothetical protein n=1 Tax=Streptomyces sp. NPDC057554 TaxID=3350538 RepID=UPI003694B741
MRSFEDTALRGFMGRQAERHQGDAERGGNVGRRGEIPWPVALVHGVVAGSCTAFGVALSLLYADGVSAGLVLFWVLILAAGPAAAVRRFGMPREKRRFGRVVGQGLVSVLWQAMAVAPFTSLFIFFAPTDTLFWPILLVWLFSGGFCALWAKAVSRERPSAAVARPGEPPSPPPLAAARSAEEERAITEFGELLAHHPFDASLPVTEYVERADYSLALTAYEQARAARPGEVLGILAEGRTALARLDARMGLDTVQSRTGCFFDHRHGPAVASVEWAPAGGTRRRIEVCRADAVRLADELGR